MVYYTHTLYNVSVSCRYGVLFLRTVYPTGMDVLYSRTVYPTGMDVLYSSTVYILQVWCTVLIPFVHPAGMVYCAHTLHILQV
jgi:hypothetical protein